MWRYIMKFNIELIYAFLVIFCFLLPIVEPSNEINYNCIIESNDINYRLNNTEKPEWEIGESWTYSSDINLNIIEDGVEISVYLSLNNLNLKIEEIIDENLEGGAEVLKMFLNFHRVFEGQWIGPDLGLYFHNIFFK